MSYGVLDTAETLVENIDDLADVLDKLREKYEQAQVQVRFSSVLLNLLHVLFVINRHIYVEIYRS